MTPRRTGPREYPSPELTAILPSPDTSPTSVIPFQTLRDALSGGSRTRPASVHDLPLWRPGVAPNAPSRPYPTPPAAATEQTDIRAVTSHVIGHVYRHRFNTCRTDLEAVPDQWANDCDDVMRDAANGIALIMAELDSVAESMGFRSAAVRRLGRSLAFGGLSPDDVLAELYTLG